MSHNTRTFDCSPDDVFDVLEAGWSYASWVVGAARIRDVDATWPRAGSEIHHSVGVWPLMINDSTSVWSVNRPRELVLSARAWPIGRGRVRITCEPEGNQTTVTLDEEVTAGPALKVLEPIRNLVLHWRNSETLRRLAYLAENGPVRSRGSSPASRARVS